MVSPVTLPARCTLTRDHATKKIAARQGSYFGESTIKRLPARIRRRPCCTGTLTAVEWRPHPALYVSKGCSKSKMLPKLRFGSRQATQHLTITNTL
jgi:hypothetical protein